MQQDIYAQNWLKARAKALQNGLKIVEIGWEQHVIIDEDAGTVYRYPRHYAAAAKLADEVAVLRDIHRQQWPVELPVMLDHNTVYTSYEYIAGEVLTEEVTAALQPSDFERIGRKLGEFLAQFHKLDFAIVKQKQTSHVGSLLEYYAARINNAHDVSFKPKAQVALAELSKLAGQVSPVVVHGDLHGPNIVINPSSNELAGVIDLSEMEIGDPHLEFRKIFMTFPASLDASLENYTSAGGQKLGTQTIVLWAYTNEWANLCYFAQEPSNLTYQRAQQHLKQWGQL